MNNKFYITTTLPYVNADPHIGFALEIIQADVIARYHRLLKQDVVFNFGTDEHGQKIYQKAVELHKDPKTYCDEYAAKFDDLKRALNLSYTNFVRTTDESHMKAAANFWKICDESGFIEKKKYKIKYCVGCELEKTDSELKDGKCPLHPNQDLETREEDNYFFKFSQFGQKLLSFYERNPDFIVPESKYKEIKSFVKAGLEDFSISRIKDKMPWGIGVPGDSTQVMYVWFDALINYVSTLGWPEDMQNFKEYWPGIQVAGKDNLRQQTAMWQAMLMAAGLPNSKQVFIHGFLTVDGQKISKSLGNTINPIELADKYGTDAVRFYLLSQIHPWEDSDFSTGKLEETYNSGLANGIGNLVSRVARLCQNSGLKFEKEEVKFNETIGQKINEFKFHEAMAIIGLELNDCDQTIDREQPWKLDGDKLGKVLSDLISKLRQIALNLKPFLPETAERVLNQFEGPEIEAQSPMFPRLK